MMPRDIMVASRPPKAIIHVNEGRAHLSKACQSTSKGNVLPSSSANLQYLLTLGWGFNIHMWALSTHEGPS